MKVRKLSDYSEGYPKKSGAAAKIGVAAAAALLAVATAACRPDVTGKFPVDDTAGATELQTQPVVEGEPAVDETESVEP